MGTYLTKRWEGNDSAPRPKERRSGTFAAYVPPPLTGWQPQLSAEVAEFVDQAEQSLRDASARFNSPAGEGVCFWAESLGSSHIEDVTPNPRLVARSLAARQHTGQHSAHGAVAEVIANIDATTQAHQMLTTPSELSLRSLLDAHSTLMNASPTPHIAGKIRARQNWIGGSGWHPLEADFVPPPPELCLPLLEDLITYIRSDIHSPLLQAALAHAQFETIHPFSDGNGRTGRALMHAILKRRCGLERLTPPISLALSRNKNDYIDALTKFHYVGDPDDPARSAALVRWLEVLTDAVHASSKAVTLYEAALEALKTKWLTSLAISRKQSLETEIVNLLPVVPSFSLKTVSEMLRRSDKQVSDALRRLQEVGILTVRSAGPGLRVYEADRVLDAFAVMSSTVSDMDASLTDYERVLSEPFLPPSPSSPGRKLTRPTITPQKPSRSELQAAILAAHKAHPSESNTQIARRVGASRSYVSKVLAAR